MIRNFMLSMKFLSYNRYIQIGKLMQTEDRIVFWLSFIVAVLVTITADLQFVDQKAVNALINGVFIVPMIQAVMIYIYQLVKISFARASDQVSNESTFTEETLEGEEYEDEPLGEIVQQSEKLFRFAGGLYPEWVEIDVINSGIRRFYFESIYVNDPHLEASRNLVRLTFPTGVALLYKAT